MDAERFDAIARKLGARATRRGALAGLIGTGLAGAAAVRAARNDRRGKKGRRGAGRPRAKANCANPGPSKTLNGCDFSGKNFSGKDLSGSEINDATFANAELVGADLSDSSMRRTTFRGANLCRATLTSASLNKADFRGADGPNGRPTNLTRADLRSSGCGGVQFDANTIFCGTRMCDGAIRNDDCPAGVDPEHACCTDADCGPNRICRNGACVPDAGTCTAGQDFCQNSGTASCNGDSGWDCFVTASGASFCGLSGFCSGCSRGEEGAAVTGPGSACVDTTGESCGCDNVNNRACVSPCGPCANDAQCGAGRVCCGGECKFGNCCSAVDCGGDGRCVQNHCTCDGCRAGHDCRAGDAWGQCGNGGAPCAECHANQVCAANQTCVSCEFGRITRGTYCDVRENFAKHQCGPNCACAENPQALGFCFNSSANAYCTTGPEPICEFSADCVIEGLGDYCILAGECAERCNKTVCVTRCGSGDEGGPPQLVVVD
jgi:hypothetical protein